MTRPLGTFTKFCDLSAIEQQIVQLARQGADSSADHKLCFNSNFPVGAGILAVNEEGVSKVFNGGNVENGWFPPTICAERTAATKAAFEGFKQFKIVAVFCRKFPGGSPCGLCRQVLVQFGRDATLLNIVDHDGNVRKAQVGDLLPAACATAIAIPALTPSEQKLVKRVATLQKRSHVPYSQRPGGALFLASNEEGHRARLPRRLRRQCLLWWLGSGRNSRHANSSHCRLRQQRHPDRHGR